MIAVLLGLFPLFGCEPVISHQMLSRVFNGVPEPPSQEAFCSDYYQKLKTREGAAVASATPGEETAGSKHEPYAEKRCNGCHVTEGGVSNALLKPKDELCLICHKGVASGLFVHGPVSSGDCLACHEPHESANTALLIKPRGKICDACHEEKRVAAAMHGRLTRQGLACPDCHDPHAGKTKFFIK